MGRADHRAKEPPGNACDRELQDGTDPTRLIDIVPRDELPIGDTSVAEPLDEHFSMVTVPFKRGAVVVYPRSDLQGRANSGGNHQEYGGSGYFRASIFDGNKWRNFKILNFISEEERSYTEQNEFESTREMVVSRINEHAGAVAVSHDGTYELQIVS